MCFKFVFSHCSGKNRGKKRRILDSRQSKREERNLKLSKELEKIKTILIHFVDCLIMWLHLFFFAFILVFGLGGVFNCLDMYF